MYFAMIFHEISSSNRTHLDTHIPQPYYTFSLFVMDDLRAIILASSLFGRCFLCLLERIDA